MKILMVCLGNICRSPMAEGIMKQLIYQNGLNWEVQSAGTESYHIGEPPHQSSIKVCAEHNIDISSQRAQKFTLALYQQFDLIYAMATDVLQEIKHITASSFDASVTKLILNELPNSSMQSVPDPYYGDYPDYEYAFDLIYKSCAAIIEKYKHE